MENETESLWTRIKNKVKNNYFNLTMFYLAVYGIGMGVICYGLNYLVDGSLNFGDMKTELAIVASTLMFTMGTMVKKLKDDIVSNYWKQQRQINSRKGRRK